MGGDGNMISWIANYLVRFLLSKGLIDDEKMEIYQYGYEILTSSFITLLIVIVLGAVIKCLFASLLYFVIFASMRLICGGYHAKHYWSCNLIFTIVTATLLLLFKYIPMDGYASIHYTTLVFSVLVVFVYAPVENKNKMLNTRKKTLFRIISRITVVLYALLSCLIYILQIPYSKLIDLTLLVVAISIWIGDVVERRDNHGNDGS